MPTHNQLIQRFKKETKHTLFLPIKGKGLPDAIVIYPEIDTICFVEFKTLNDSFRQMQARLFYYLSFYAHITVYGTDLKIFLYQGTMLVTRYADNNVGFVTKLLLALEKKGGFRYGEEMIPLFSVEEVHKRTKVNLKRSL